MKYSWNNVGFNADANKVGKELESIQTLENLTNKEVLDYAKKHKDSEVYKCFDWNNETAGEKWRLQQASKILCSISIVIDENKKPVEKTRVYVSTKSKDEEKRTFKKLVDVLEDDEEYQALLLKAKDELNNCQEKYRSIIKLQDLKDIIFDIYKNI